MRLFNFAHCSFFSPLVCRFKVERRGMEFPAVRLLNETLALAPTAGAAASCRQLMFADSKPTRTETVLEFAAEEDHAACASLVPAPSIPPCP